MKRFLDDLATTFLLVFPTFIYLFPNLPSANRFAIIEADYRSLYFVKGLEQAERIKVIDLLSSLNKQSYIRYLTGMTDGDYRYAYMRDGDFKLWLTDGPPDILVKIITSGNAITKIRDFEHRLSDEQKLEIVKYNQFYFRFFKNPTVDMLIECIRSNMVCDEAVAFGVKNLTPEVLAALRARRIHQFYFSEMVLPLELYLTYVNSMHDIAVVASYLRSSTDATEEFVCKFTGKAFQHLYYTGKTKMRGLRIAEAVNYVYTSSSARLIEEDLRFIRILDSKYDTPETGPMASWYMH